MNLGMCHLVESSMKLSFVMFESPLFTKRCRAPVKQKSLLAAFEDNVKTLDRDGDDNS